MIEKCSISTKRLNYKKKLTSPNTKLIAYEFRAYKMEFNKFFKLVFNNAFQSQELRYSYLDNFFTRSIFYGCLPSIVDLTIFSIYKELQNGYNLLFISYNAFNAKLFLLKFKINIYD